MANSVDPDQTAPIRAVCSGSTLFASILNSLVTLGNYLQHTTFSIAFFSWRFKGLKFRVFSPRFGNMTLPSEFGIFLQCFIQNWGKIKLYISIIKENKNQVFG